MGNISAIHSVGPNSIGLSRSHPRSLHFSRRSQVLFQEEGCSQRLCRIWGCFLAACAGVVGQGPVRHWPRHALALFVVSFLGLCFRGACAGVHVPA